MSFKTFLSGINLLTWYILSTLHIKNFNPSFLHRDYNLHSLYWITKIICCLFNGILYLWNLWHCCCNILSLIACRVSLLNFWLIFSRFVIEVGKKLLNNQMAYCAKLNVTLLYASSDILMKPKIWEIR